MIAIFLKPHLEKENNYLLTLAFLSANIYLFPCIGSLSTAVTVGE